MKKLFLIVFFLLITMGFAKQSQAEWATTMRISSYSEIKSVLQDIDGGYVMLAESWYHRELTLVKTDINGKIIWQKMYYLENNTAVDFAAYALARTTDGGYVLVGNVNRNRIWIIKIDSVGNILWQKISNYYSFYLQAVNKNVLQTKDGGYIIADWSGFYGASDFGLIKLNPNGSFSWRRVYGGAHWDIVRSVIETQDGGYLLSGYEQPDGTNANVWILKLNSDGSVQWQKNIGSTDGGRQTGFLAVQASDGYILGGHTSSFGASYSDVWILKIDLSGNILWQKRFSGLGSESINDIKETPDGGIVFVGFTQLFYTGGASEYLWIVKLNHEGAIVWDKAYAPNSRGNSIDITKDGGYIIGGRKNYNNSSSYYEMFLLKLDVNGNIPDCSMVKKEGFTQSFVTNGIISNTNKAYATVGGPGDIIDSSAITEIPNITPQYVCQVTNHAPTANAGNDIVITSQEGTSTVITGLANDQDVGDQLRYRWLENGVVIKGWMSTGAGGQCPLALSNISIPVGTHVLRLEVEDGEASSYDDMNLVIGNTAPYISLSGGGTFNLSSVVQLEASLSDYDGDLITYEWLDGSEKLCSGSIQSTCGGTPVTLPVCNVDRLAMGTHTITLRVSDGVNVVSNNVIVDIVDRTAPTLAPTISSNLLWPPNHKMVDILIQANAHDNAGGPIHLSAKVFSNEPENGLGDGDAYPDWSSIEIDQETGLINLQLRAERGGSGNGREYTIKIDAQDSSGNISSTNLMVVVPHDKRTQ